MLSIHGLSETQTANGGTLYVVATPIGNLQDITLRAINILKTVNIVAAEDTRHTGLLLNHFGIKAQLVSCHDFNEHERSLRLIERMISGESVALVSDAGTPSVSDPGYKMVKNAIEKGIPVVPVPGVSAAIAALSASGLPTDSFVFLGFPQKKKKLRDEQIQELKNERRTIIMYESPRRIASLLEELRNVLGDREAVLARELTKMHEEFLRGKLSKLIQILSERNQLKGECTLVLSGSQKKEADMDQVVEEIKSRLASGTESPSFLSKELSKKYALGRKSLYDEILRIIGEIS